MGGLFVRSERWSVLLLLLLLLLRLPVLFLLAWWLREREGHQRLQVAALLPILLNVLLNELPQLFLYLCYLLFSLAKGVRSIALPSLLCFLFL